MHLYDDLAGWWPLLSPVEDYADEAAALADLLTEAGIGAGARLLELGSGGGHLAHHWQDRYRLTLVDRAEPMLALSHTLNPRARHLAGDMRTVRLGERFDAVVIGDAIAHMGTDADLAAALATAAEHCLEGGAALFCPDQVAETFVPSASTGGTDAADGRGIRYLEWLYPMVEGGGVRMEMAYLLRTGEGGVSVVHDRSVLGLFSTAEWQAAILRAGFADMRAHTVSDRTVFLARR